MESAYDRLFSGLNSSGARGAAPAITYVSSDAVFGTFSIIGHS
jgi:hypothetical protein